MKVALVGPTYPFRGGIAHYTTLLYHALTARHDVRFISWHRQYPRFLFPGRSDLDPGPPPARAVHVDRVLDSLDPRSWFRAARRLTDHEPELVIFQWWVAFWAPHFWTLCREIRRRHDSRIVFLCHNAIEHESNWLKITATRLVLRHADQVFTHAEPETRRLDQLLDGRVEVSTAFHPTYAALGGEAPSRADARESLQVSGPVLLFFGFVRPYKGLDVLLDALPLVLQSMDVTLLVVGEFWHDKTKYLESLRRNGIEHRVRLVDRYVPDPEVGRWFAAADLVVQPYRSASGSGICQLAYGRGRPVVATRVGSLAEVVQDGVNGRLVEPEQPAALAQAIVDSLDPQTLQRLTHEAANTAERFSWEALVEILTASTTSTRAVEKMKGETS